MSAGRIRGRAGTLLATQGLFNIGFFAVVPFLAVVLAEDFALGAAAVGVVLGVRTFAQQGMFLLGGLLADRWGARTVILAGCAVRVTGFLTLAASVRAEAPLLALFVAGTVLTGLGGALFSPGLNVLVAQAEARRAHGGAAGRASLFAWLGVCGEVGAVIGPLLGAALFGWGFALVATSGAVYFAAIGLFLLRALPAGPPHRPSDRGPEDRAGDRAGIRTVLRDRSFLAFCVLHAADLVAFNQLYLLLPLALRQAGGGARTVAVMFAWASVLTLCAQIPVSRWSSRAGAPRALRSGYLLLVAAFGLLALGSLLPLEPPARIAAVMLAVTALMLGHLTVSPTALGLVPRLAGGRGTGAFFGLLSSCGGAAVLLVSTAAGRLMDLALAHPAAAPLPWLLLAALPLASALRVPRVLAGRLGERTG